MTAVVVAALGVTLAVVGIHAGRRPRRRSAPEVLRVLVPVSTTRSPMSSDPGEEDRANAEPRVRVVARAQATLGRYVEPVVVRRSLLPAEVGGWIRVTNGSVELLLGEVCLGALVGLLLPWFVVVATSAVGVRLPLQVPMWVGLALGALGLGAPILELRSRAQTARRTARTVVASFLDLVVLCLAGGMGVESALHAAARVTEDPFSARIRRALDLARDSGQTPWRALAGMGTDMGLDELVELSAAIGLAGSEGARIRATLAAKAASIRCHELAEAESEANALTERLFIPGALLLVGFLLFVGYPAVARIASGI